MKIPICIFLLALMSYTEGKSIKQAFTSSQTSQEDLRLKRSVFDIIPKRRMEKTVNWKDFKTFHNWFVRINQLGQKARLMKMLMKKQKQVKRQERATVQYRG